MKRIVISQPMFFPWVGLFEQVRLADVFVHYDDALFPQGRHFISRVEIKTKDGSKWLTAPVNRGHGAPIHTITFDESQDWRDHHLRALHHSYAQAPFFSEMISLAEEAYSQPFHNLADFNCFATERIAEYYELRPRFLRSAGLGIASRATEKLVELVNLLEGDVYVTGHGARNYMDHELFERNGVSVQYMHYQRTPYPQLHGAFDPHVTILDLIANMGKKGIELIHSGTVGWKEFLAVESQVAAGVKPR
ncbi:MAG: WbqC family protein [Terriglobales bacterium]